MATSIEPAGGAGIIESLLAPARLLVGGALAALVALHLLEAALVCALAWAGKGCNINHLCLSNKLVQIGVFIPGVSVSGDLLTHMWL